MSYCTQCGTAVRPEQAFCTKCGAELRQQSEPSALGAPHGQDSSVGTWPNAETGGGQPPPPAPYQEVRIPPPAPAADWHSPQQDPSVATQSHQPPGTSEPPSAWMRPSPATAPEIPPGADQADGPAGSSAAGPPGGATGWPDPSPTSSSGWTPQTAPPPGRPNKRRAATVITVVVALLLLGGGTAAAWRLLGHKATGQLANPTAAGRRSAPKTTAPSGNHGPTAPSTSTQTVGPDTVTIAPAVGQQASAPQVAAFLGSYFRAINSRNYTLYSSLYEPPLRPTPGNFYQGYQTTSDSGAVLTGLSRAPAGLAASVSFTSHQNPADSPTDTSCTTWDITLYLQPSGSTYQIGRPPPGYHAQYEACS
jgi:hypothetical protein